jgi:hypothetical protein
VFYYINGLARGVGGSLAPGADYVSSSQNTEIVRGPCLGTSMTKTTSTTSRDGCFVLATSELRRLSTFCISERRRMLNGVPTQEAAIFRTRAQLCQKWQAGVWSIARALYLHARLHVATGLQQLPIYSSQYPSDGCISKLYY